MGVTISDSVARSFLVGLVGSWHRLPQGKLDRSRGGAILIHVCFETQGEIRTVQHHTWSVQYRLYVLYTVVSAH